MNRTPVSLRSHVTTGERVGKRQERIRAHSPTGRVAGAATEMLSGSQPSSSTACPTHVLPRAPIPVRPTLTPRPDATAGTLTRAVSSPEVVGGGDEPPFRAARSSSAALEAADLAVELQLAEDRLDRRLALAVERAAVRGGEQA